MDGMDLRALGGADNRAMCSKQWSMCGRIWAGKGALLSCILWIIAHPTHLINGQNSQGKAIDILMSSWPNVYSSISIVVCAEESLPYRCNATQLLLLRWWKNIFATIPLCSSMLRCLLAKIDWQDSLFISAHKNLPPLVFNIHWMPFSFDRSSVCYHSGKPLLNSCGEYLGIAQIFHFNEYFLWMNNFGFFLNEWILWMDSF